MLNPSERKRVRLRLLSHWHPDRNPDRVQLCTQICQHIGLYVQCLENGQSLDEPISSASSFDTSFYDEVTRRTRLQREHRNSSSQSYSGYHQATRQQPHPHRGEAERWLKQAQRDLEAAKSTFSSDDHNWTCYKSHQVCPSNQLLCFFQH